MMSSIFRSILELSFSSEQSRRVWNSKLTIHKLRCTKLPKTPQATLLDQQSSRLNPLSKNTVRQTVTAECLELVVSRKRSVWSVLKTECLFSRTNRSLNREWTNEKHLINIDSSYPGRHKLATIRHHQAGNHFKWVIGWTNLALK